LALKADTTFLTWVRGDLEPWGRRNVRVDKEMIGVAVVASVGVTDALPVRPVKVDIADLDGVLLYPLISDWDRECVPGVLLESEETELGALGPDTADPPLLIFVGDDERLWVYALLPYPSPLVVYPSPPAVIDSVGMVWLYGVVE
jgi:hypothetical protein